jgi:ABC-type uncharacterized transport system permease subunit
MAPIAPLPLASSDPFFWEVLAYGAAVLYGVQILATGNVAGRLGRNVLNWTLYAIVLPVIAYVHVRLLERRER